MLKSDKLKRLVKVQRQLERMAETELADVSRQRQDLAENLAAAVDAVGSLDPVHQRFTTIYSNQISRLTLRDHHLEAMQSIHEQKILRERAKADKLEENFRDAREDEDRTDADNRIYDLVDQQIAIEQAQASSKLDEP